MEAPSSKVLLTTAAAAAAAGMMPELDKPNSRAEACPGHDGRDGGRRSESLNGPS